VDAVVGDGSSALFYASLKGKVEIVELLIAHGAEVNRRRNGEGQTALHWSSQNRHIEVAKVLLAHGADLELADSVVSSIGELGILCKGMSCTALLLSSVDNPHDTEAQNSCRPLPPVPYLPSNNLQNSQRPKRRHDVLIHALQPLLLKCLLATCCLNRGLQVLADERN
jgi:Ankyrin repeats (many copies)